MCSLKNSTGEKKCALAVGTALAGLLFASSASAGLLVDRGLPGANLNNPAGGDRSNVAWEWDAVSSYVGDTFMLPDHAKYDWRIDTIRTWMIFGSADNDSDLGNDTASLGDSFSSLELHLGTTASPLPVVMSGNFVGTGSNDTDNAGISISRVQYSGGGTELDYQGSSGGYLQIFQIDWDVDMVLAAGSEVAFGVDGLSANDDQFWFNHASNKDLSGTPQQYADDLMHVYDSDVAYLGSFDSDRSSTAGTLFNGGWDKSSDINVQVFGTLEAVPEPMSIALMGLGLIGMGAVRRRRNRV